MKLAKLIALILLCAALTIAAVYAVLVFEIAPASNTQSTEYLFYVNQSIGFDVESDIMRLGEITPGATARRAITIQDPSATSVRTVFSGPGSEWLRASPQPAEFVNGSTEIVISVHPPQNASYGTYRGSIEFRKR